jgi:hypothetical protein
LHTIGITGKAGHGKDTAALLICDIWAKARGANSTFRVAFADALKAEVVQTFGLPDESLLRDPKRKDNPSYLLSPGCCENQSFRRIMMHRPIDPISFDASVTPRQVMQLWGTEYRRNQNAQYWHDQVEQAIDISEATGKSLAIITDVRFVNEAKFLESVGSQIVRIERDAVKGPPGNHASEVEQRSIEVTQTFQNTTIEHLRAQLYKFLQPMLASAQKEKSK